MTIFKVPQQIVSGCSDSKHVDQKICKFLVKPEFKNNGLTSFSWFFILFNGFLSAWKQYTKSPISLYLIFLFFRLPSWAHTSKLFLLYGCLFLARLSHLWTELTQWAWILKSEIEMNPVERKLFFEGWCHIFIAKNLRLHCIRSSSP